MDIADIEGATRTLGKSQGYNGLPIRDVLVDCSVGGEGTPAMESEWKPTAEELEALNNGGSIKLTVLGTVHPPVMLDVQPSQPASASAEPDAYFTGSIVRFDERGKKTVTCDFAAQKLTFHAKD